MARQIEYNTKTFVKFWLIPLIIAAVLFFIYKALTGLVIIGISIFLALALKPLVRKVNNFFTKHFGKDRKHQTASVILAYLIVVLIIGAIVAIVGPVVVNETSKFIQHFPETFEKTFGGWEGINNFGKGIGIEDLHSEIISALNSLSNSMLGLLGNNLVASVSGIADIVMKIVLVLVITLLLLLEGPELMDMLWQSLASGDENKKPIKVAKQIVHKMSDVVSTYVSRQVIVAMIDGLASGLIVFLLSLFLSIPSSLAIPMGLTTMIFYLIPMFGQFIGGTLVTLILLFSSPVAGLIFAIVYIIYAQIENNIISPKIQGSALNLQPIIILIAITIGMYMFGLLGAIIAIPIAGCIKILIEEYPAIKAASRNQ